MSLDLRALTSNFTRPPGFGQAPEIITPANAFMRAALEQHKEQGEGLAVRARFWALGTTAVMLFFVVDWPEVVYYHGLLALFAILGVIQRRTATIGRNPGELRLLFADLALMTIVCLVPNPLVEQAMPLAVQYQFDVFIFFFVFLAAATLAYAWQTIVAIGVWTACLWAIGLGAILYLDSDPDGLGPKAQALYADNALLRTYYDPTDPVISQRIQETVAFLIVAGILAVSGRRSTRLLLRQVEAERARANLSRYFSPNVVDSLSQNDEPLREIRAQEITVLFVDIVGFTAYAAGRPPEAVIETLRAFHARMEAEVFAHDGTLDKYLGDGLMVTFGTPVASPGDARDALACAQAMVASVAAWNAEREAAGSLPIRASFGLHSGPVVLGDIGANRLEFAVIGNTVNIASRLEGLSRPLGVRLVASDALVARARAQGAAEASLAPLVRQDGQTIRGLEGAMTVWTQS